MFDSHAATLGGAKHRAAPRSGGVTGNARLTGAVAVALLVLLAPGVVLTTVALFATGVALLFAGRASGTLAFAHKLSFIAWVALMALHVLGHLLELPRLASADWRRHGPREARLAGAGMRASAVTATVVVGVGLGFLGLSVGSSWL
jgi:hypothetical protein